MRSFLRLALVIPLILVGCDSSTDPAEDITGTYTLRTVDGVAVPVVVWEDAEWKEEVVSGSVRLNSGDTCVITMSWRSTDKATDEVHSEVSTDACTYSVSGNTVVFHEQGEADVVGVISGDTLTVDLDVEGVWVFRK
jgi:uncharacterized lipoprotein NlpE involved in copper resistance